MRSLIATFVFKKLVFFCTDQQNQSAEYHSGKTTQRPLRSRFSGKNCGLITAAPCKFSYRLDSFLVAISHLNLLELSWSKGINIIPNECSADFSNVVMSNGQGYVQGKIPCYLCGKTRGMKSRCSHSNCRARGEKKQAYYFHVSCARQAGYEVNHDDDPDDKEEFYGEYHIV